MAKMTKKTTVKSFEIEPCKQHPMFSLDKSKIRILLLEGVDQSAVNNFQKQGYTNIEYVKDTFLEDELKEKIANIHILGIRSTTHITKNLLESAKKLIAIGCFCIGTNQVDIQGSMERGIPVFNAPYSNTRSVAELVLAEMIMLLRDIPRKNMAMHKGIWCKSAKDSNEVRGKKLGIIGYGNIGSQLSILAEALGMRVIFYDIITKLPLGNANQVNDLETLLKESDVVSLHVPETPTTRNMIGPRELSLMKKGSVLINASRGTVIDLNALKEALQNNHLKGVALDVYPEEPAKNNDSFKSFLQDMDNVIMTPHIGGSTQEAQVSIGLEVSEKLIKYSDNGSTISAVNFPEVSLPSHVGKHRFLHIHKNIPGMLSAINKVFSEDHINIAAQYLQTNAKIGYVVIDVDEAEYKDSILKRLQDIEGTIRSRVIF